MNTKRVLLTYLFFCVICRVIRELDSEGYTITALGPLEPIDGIAPVAQLTQILCRKQQLYSQQPKNGQSAHVL